MERKIRLRHLACQVKLVGKGNATFQGGQGNGGCGAMAQGLLLVVLF